jgi:hypothetical protein
MTLVTMHLAADPESGARVRYKHDCDCCTFVGSLICDSDENPYDVYVCGGKPSLGTTEDNMSLIMRFDDEGPQYSSFPVYVARLVSRGDQDHRWAGAVQLYDQWAALGCPDASLLLYGDQFFDHFTVAVSFEDEEPKELDESGTRARLVGLSPRVTEEDIEYYVQTRFPHTYCQHEHDCCGNIYWSPAIWAYVEGSHKRAIWVHQHWGRNI